MQENEMSEEIIESAGIEMVEDIDAKEILESIKLTNDNNDDDINDDADDNKTEAVFHKTLDEIEIDDETKNLYSDFNSFLEQKADIKPDSGVKTTIPTGLDLLDAILGGGFALGTMAIITGQPGSGKSMVSMQALANAQRVYKGDMLGSFLDSEEATTILRLSNLGVRYPKIKPYSDITIEKVFKFLEGLCLFKEEKKIIDKPSIVIWDSIANTLSEKERAAEDPNSVIGYKARLLSILIPKYVAKCAQYNICFLAVNQLRDVLNLGQFSAPKDLKFMSHSKDMPGGTILKYNAFHLLEMKTKAVVKEEKFGFDGIITNVKCVKNKIFPPNVDIDLCGNFITGFNNFWTNFTFLTKTKRIKTAAWNYLMNYPTKKFRTKEAEELYYTDPKFKEAFDELLHEGIQVDIIDKNTIDI